MINENIIRGLKPHTKINQADVSPNYCMIIEDVEQKEECNQDIVEFTLCQVNKSLQDILNNNIYSRKTLKIIANMDLNDDDFISTKLVGYEGVPEEDLEETPQYTNSHLMEVIDVILKKEIDLRFSRVYKKEVTGDNTDLEVNLNKPVLPAVIINIDKKYEKLYTSYSLEYETDGNGDYIGVKITFNGLKSKSSYPNIKIVIIGEPIEN